MGEPGQTVILFDYVDQIWHDNPFRNRKCFSGSVAHWPMMAESRGPFSPPPTNARISWRNSHWVEGLYGSTATANQGFGAPGVILHIQGAPIPHGMYAHAVWLWVTKFGMISGHRAAKVSTGIDFPPHLLWWLLCRAYTPQRVSF